LGGVAIFALTKIGIAGFAVTLLGVIILALALLVLFGWHIGAIGLIQISPVFAPMQYNTALLFLLCGAGLLAAVRGRHRVALACGLGIFFFAVLTLAQYIFGANFGIDTLFMEPYVRVGVTDPGRMAPNTALAFIFSGAALTAISLPAWPRRGVLATGGLGSLVLGFGLIAFIGYIADLKTAYGWGRLAHMAVHTAVAFTVLGTGLLALAWKRGKAEQEDHRWVTVFAFVMAGVIFLLDLAMPLGFAGGVPYMVPVLITLWSPWRPLILTMAILGSVLTVAGYFLSPEGGVFWIVLVNRVLALMVIWVTALLCLHRAQTEGARQREILAGVLEIAPDAIVSIDVEGVIRIFNKGAEKVFGWKAEEVLGRSLDLLLPAVARGGHKDQIKRYRASSSAPRLMGLRREITGLRKDGSEFPAEASISRMESGGEEILTVIMNDITLRKKTEERLSRAQKMETIGQLAGGVAHEFNNMLMGLQGSLELIGDISENEDVNRLVEQALGSADHGKELTRDLLAYSRQKKVAAEPLDPVAVIARAKGNLLRVLGESIIIENASEADIWNIAVDSGEMEAALVNLAINARDAMPEGGQITIECTNMTIGGQTKEKPIAVGDYVMIAVTDTGTGMSADTMSHVFDPFFTTKEIGKGTGLGLSMVYGFARQSGGIAEIESEEGVGTTVRLYFPKAEGAVEAKTIARVETTAEALRGGETILFVEDDEVVRMIGSKMLRSLGYKVFEAEDGPSAIEILNLQKGIHLLMTDVVMPGGVNGVELAQAALKISPQIDILLSTGYNTVELDDDGYDGKEFMLLEKPYKKIELARKLRELLDGSSPA
jgi:PAS domain S-box-containing protein